MLLLKKKKKEKPRVCINMDTLAVTGEGMHTPVDAGVSRRRLKLLYTSSQFIE